MKEIITKKLNILKRFLKESDVLLEKIISIFTKEENNITIKIQNTMKHLNTLLNDMSNIDFTQTSIINLVSLYEKNENVNKLTEILQENLDKILDKKINVETFLSQTFIDETREYNNKSKLLFSKHKKNIKDLDKQLLDKIIEILYTQIYKDDIYDNFQKFTIIIQKTINTSGLYKLISNKILEKTTEVDIQLSYNILNIIQEYINFVLDNTHQKEKSIKYNDNNPFLKSFGISAVTEVMDIESISQKVFNKKEKTLKGFTNLCKLEKYDLIHIKKYLNRGLSYNILPLLDFKSSKVYEKNNSVDDGITEDLIERYKTITYLSDKSTKWTIDYKYLLEKEEHKFVIVLQELNSNQFCVISNKLYLMNEMMYFMRKSQIKDFLYFVKNKKFDKTRVNNYNKLINKNIVQNMFLHVQPDIESLQVKSQLADPKYLRHELYISLFSKFKELYDKKSPKSVYEFSKLLHNQIFENMFSQILMNEYYKYLFKNISIFETENISLSEVYSSFLYTMNIYERDFKKQMHDVFLTNVPNTEVFKSDKKDKILVDLFEEILKKVLNLIITNNSNIYQSIMYKLYLFKLSLLD